MMRDAPRRLDTAVVFVGALLLFSTGITEFEARPTDLSALRVLAGDIPYRDFWTMYAPGSFVTLALALRVSGAELLVSNGLGVLASAAGVALCFRLARRTCGAGMAAGLALLVAAAYAATGYAVGFTSYPPAFCFILAAADLVVSRSHWRGWTWAVGPGLLLGVAALFKHDVAGYALLSLCAAIFVVGLRGGVATALAPVAGLAGSAAGVVAAAIGVLASLGAAHDAWRDLVRFPLGDFRYVRPEYFPLVPHLQPTLVDTLRDVRGWAICNLPTIALLAGLVALWRARRSVDDRTALLCVFATVVFAFHWSAAHVQINTNAISLAAWGGLVGAAGLQRIRFAGRAHRAMLGALVAGWAGLLVAEPLYLAAAQRNASTAVDLPHLRGIRASADDVGWMRELAATIGQVAPADAPLLFVSARNDVVIYAQSFPFWLSDRRPATRHHEVHPGITDTAPVQEQMLAQLARGPLPVVVREHRFDDRTLDAAKMQFAQHVAVGSTALDSWIEQHYVSGPTSGRYEVMRPRDSARAGTDGP